MSQGFRTVFARIFSISFYTMDMAFVMVCFNGFVCTIDSPTCSIALVHSSELHLKALGVFIVLKPEPKDVQII